MIYKYGTDAQWDTLENSGLNGIMVKPGCDHTTFDNCEFAHTAACATTFRDVEGQAGSVGTRITDCLFHDLNYAGAGVSSIGLSSFDTSTMVTYNTIYNMGRSSFSNLGTIAYNDIHDNCVISDDCGIYYTVWINGDGQGSEFHHNIMHTSYDILFGALIYQDYGGWNRNIHHNVLAKGTGHTPLPVKEGPWGLSFNTIVGFSHNDIGYGPRDDDGSYDSTNLISSPEELADNTWLFSDPLHMDYTLQDGSPAIDAAWEKNTVIFGNSTLPFEMEPWSGTAPDRGAFEYGQVPWRAGRHSGDGYCAAPTFQPSYRFLAPGETVGMSSLTPDADIRYTLDGSDPTAVSQQYSAPITVSTSYGSLVTVKARTYKNGLVSSPATSIAYEGYRMADSVSGAQAGLDVKIYSNDEPYYETYPDFTALTPFRTAVVGDFWCDKDGVPNNRYGAMYEGYIGIPEDGLYSFWAETGWGNQIRLLVGDRQVVECKGRDYSTPPMGQIGLEAGMHVITVLRLGNWMDICDPQNSNAPVVLSIAGPGMAKQEIPSSILFHGGALLPTAGDERGNARMMEPVAIHMRHPTLSVAIADAAPYSMELISVSGRVVRVLSGQSSGTHVLASRQTPLAAGMYMIRVRAGRYNLLRRVQWLP